MGSDYLWGYNGPVRRAEINEACFCGWEALMARFCNCTCSLCLILSTPGYVKPSWHLNFTSCMTSAQSWCDNILLLTVFQYCIVLNTLMSLSVFAKHCWVVMPQLVAEQAWTERMRKEINSSRHLQHNDSAEMLISVNCYWCHVRWITQTWVSSAQIYWFEHSFLTPDSEPAL